MIESGAVSRLTFAASEEVLGLRFDAKYKSRTSLALVRVAGHLVAKLFSRRGCDGVVGVLPG